MQDQIEQVIFVGDSPPPLVDGEQVFTFWFDTDKLELLIDYNGQWFPVSIPPSQVAVLSEIIEGLEVSVTQVRRDVALNKIDIDELALDSAEERKALKSEFDGKFATIEQELEQLAPSLEKGKWNFTFNYPPAYTEYTMIKAFLDESDQEDLCNQAYAACSAAAAGDPTALAACNREYQACQDAIDGSKVVTTDSWRECKEIVFNNVDNKGVTHYWEDLDSDHYIDVFNESDQSFMIGNVSSNDGGAITFDLESKLGHANGLATVKIFKIEGSVDFDQYVRKAGDTVTGDLRVKPGSLKTLNIDSGENSNLNIKRNGEGKIVVRNTEVKFDVPIKLNTSAPPPSADSAAPRKFAENITGRPFIYRSHGDPSQLKYGEFTYQKNQSGNSPGDAIYINDHDANKQSVMTNGKGVSITEPIYIKIFSASEPSSALVGMCRASKANFGNDAAEGTYCKFDTNKSY